MHYMADPVHLQPAQAPCERQYTTADTDIRCWFLERYMAERQDESTAAREVSRRNLLEDMLQYSGIELRRFIWDLALPWAKVDQQRCFEQRFQEPLLWGQDMPQHHGPSPEGIRAILRAVWRRVAADFLDALRTHASGAFSSLSFTAQIKRITKLYACFHPGCAARGCRSAKGAASMDAAAKACRRLHGARGALSLQRSTTSILLNGPDHASYYRCTWTSVSANKLDQAARSAPLMFHVRWCHVCLHFIYRRVVVRMHTGLSVQVSRLSVLGWICGSVHRTGRRAFASASLCAAPHVLCQHPGTGHASVSALVKLTCLRAIVRIMADALRPERLRALQTASFFGGSQAPGCQVGSTVHPHGVTGDPSFAPLLSSSCSCNKAMCLLLHELQLPAPTADRRGPQNTSRQTSYPGEPRFSNADGRQGPPWLCVASSDLAPPNFMHHVGSSLCQRPCRARGRNTATVWVCFLYAGLLVDP